MLTLFALISGLGLAATPAVAAQASVVSVVTAGDAEDCQTAVSGPLQFVSGTAMLRATKPNCPDTPITVWIPTVQIQVDRSRE
ncbi:hypothetical protein GRF63_07920 [Erythrobacter sp. GH3-10]|uniref:Uncharacterized protein n=1 Tax=Aurantiacibacter rhizosphaerae TaxID=2691582 RepID=A0A844XBH8_9SPHN|nr:hypothetical protein [Aurantiacibacter rhizosphaerae]